MPDAKYTGKIGDDPGDASKWTTAAGNALRPKEVVNSNVVRMMQKGASEDKIRSYISLEGYDPDSEITFWKRPSETQAYVNQGKSGIPITLGFERGIRNIRGNILQLLHEGRALVGTDTPGDVEKFSNEEELSRARYAQSPAGQTLMSGVGQATAESLPWLAAPVPPNIGPAANMAYGMGLGFLQGATDFVPTGGSRVNNTMAGGGIGLLGGALGSAIGPAGAKITNMIRGAYAPAEAELMNLGRRYGVRLQYPDIRPGAPLAGTMGTLLEKTPVLGTGRQRMEQAAEAQLAAGKYSESLDIGNVSDWRNATAKELENKEARLKTTVSTFYDAAARRADVVGNLPVTNTVSKINELISAESKSIDPDKALINQLTDWKLRLTQLPTNYSQLNNFQDALQGAIRESKQTGGRFLSVSGSKLQQIKKSLDSDIEPNIPKDALEYKRRADSIYRTKLEPFRDEVAKILNETDADKQFRVMMSQLKGSPSTLFNSMTPRGQDAVRYGLVKEATEIAQNTNGTWSPAKYAAYLESKKDLTNAFFSGVQRDELNGFTKLMRASQRAGQYAENPPTGLRGAVGTAITGAAIGPAVWLGWLQNSPGLATMAATGAIGVPFLTKIMFTTEYGKKFLLAAGKLKTDDPKALQLLFQYYIPRAADEGMAEARLRTQYGENLQQQPEPTAEQMLRSIRPPVGAQ